MIKRGLVIVTTLMLLALPACTSGGATLGASAKLVPASAQSYETIQNPYDWTKDKKKIAYDILKSFPNKHLAGTTTLDQFLDNKLSEKPPTTSTVPLDTLATIDFKVNVKPWLGSEFGMSSPEPNADKTIKNPSIFLLEAKNSTKAKKYVGMVNGTRDAAFFGNGYVYIAMGNDACGTNTSASSALSDAAGALDSIDSSINFDAPSTCSKSDAHTKANDAITKFVAAAKTNHLDKNADYKKEIAKLPNTRDLYAFFNVKQKKKDNQTAAQKAAADCITSSGLADSTPFYSATGDTDIKGALSALIEKKSAKISGNLTGDKPATKNSKVPAILGSLPDTTAFAVQSANYGSILDKYLTCYKQSDPTVSQGLSAYETQFGIKVNELLSWLDGELVLAGEAGVSTPKYGLVGEITNAAAANAALPKISQLADLYLTSVSGDLGSDPTSAPQHAFQLVSPGVYEISGAGALGVPTITFGIVGNRFVLGSTKEYFDQLSKPATSPLSNKPGFKQLLKASDVSTSTYYLGGTQMASLLKQGGKALNADAEKSWKAVDVVGGRVFVEGGQTKFELRAIFS